MKLAFKRLVVPRLACCFIAALVAASIVAAWQGLWALAMVIIIVAALTLTVSLFSASPRSYVVFSKCARVAELVQKTLDLLQVQFNQAGGRIIVAKTGTVIRILPLGPLSSVAFVFSEDGSPRERFLANAIMKYQRFVAL